MPDLKSKNWKRWEFSPWQKRGEINEKLLKFVLNYFKAQTRLSLLKVSRPDKGHDIKHIRGVDKNIT